MPPDIQRDWRPTASVETLNQRGEIVWGIREYFHQLGFVEVHTPVLSHDTVIDRYIDPIRVLASELRCQSAGNGELFLQTSPEFGMKRLVAAGMSAIYQIGPVFRAEERGEHHNPEFTMVEWYRVGDDLDAAVGLLSHLICRIMRLDRCEVVSYASAFQQAVTIDPLSASVNELAHAAISRGLSVQLSFSEDRDTWLNLIFAELVQPQLGCQRPTIVTHYPASQSALAQISQHQPGTAERFELFVQGVELANGYHELLNADELAARNREGLQQRAADGKSELPSSSRLIEAMRSGLPACSGCALGLDRLVMVACGHTSIDRVIPFPIERA